MAKWRDLINDAMTDHGETWADVVFCTLKAAELDEDKVSRSYGSPGGEPFTVWTEKRVYFPLEYDGWEGVGSVSRYPDGKATPHNALA